MRNFAISGWQYRCLSYVRIYISQRLGPPLHSKGTYATRNIQCSSNKWILHDDLIRRFNFYFQFKFLETGHMVVRVVWSIDGRLTETCPGPVTLGPFSKCGMTSAPSARMPTLATSWAFQKPCSPHKLKCQCLELSQTLKNSIRPLLTW